MNNLGLTGDEMNFIKQHNGYFDTKRNMVIMPKSEWVNIQNELEAVAKQKKQNEEEFYSKEKELIAKTYDLDSSVRNKENQLREKLARVQNEELSLQLKMKQNNKEVLERRYNQNEEKIKNERMNLAFFKEQRRIAEEEKLKELNQLRASEEEENRSKLKRLALDEEIINLKANERTRQCLSQLENMEKRTILQNKIAEMENKIQKINCVLCKTNPANVLFETCRHLGCCGDCMAKKFRNTKTSSELLCPVCNAVNAQSYQIIIP